MLKTMIRVFLCAISITTVVSLLDIPITFYSEPPNTFSRYSFGDDSSLKCIHTDICCSIWTAKVATLIESPAMMSPELVVSTNTVCFEDIRSGCTFYCQSIEHSSVIEGDPNFYRLQRHLEARRARQLKFFRLQCPPGWHVIRQNVPTIWKEDTAKQRTIGICIDPAADQERVVHQISSSSSEEQLCVESDTRNDDVSVETVLITEDTSSTALYVDLFVVLDGLPKVE